MTTIFNYQKIQFRKRIAHNLKAIRKQKHISQRELSEKSGIDRPFISMIENGHKSMTLDTLYRIKKVLKVDFKRFFEWR